MALYVFRVYYFFVKLASNYLYIGDFLGIYVVLLCFAPPFKLRNQCFASAELLQRIHEAVASSDSAAGGPQPDVHSKYLYFSLAELILVSGVAS